MAFFLGHAPHHKLQDPNGISIAINKHESRTAACLKVVLGSAVAARAGVEVGTAMQLWWGGGDDAGKIMVKIAPQGGVKFKHTGRATSGTLYAVFGNLHSEPIEDQEGRRWLLKHEPQVGHQAVFAEHPDGGLVITTPREWWGVLPPKTQMEAARKNALAARGAPVPLHAVRA